MGISAKSQRYKHLEKELTSLRRHLLPKKFSPIGKYRTSVITKTIAYRIMTHAEIEEYLEERAWNIAIESINQFERINKINRVIACLIAFSGQNMAGPPDTLACPSGNNVQDWAAKLSLTDKAKSALTTFKSKIERNNGIREKDILTLLLPIGIKPDQIDRVWLSTIDAFGQKRGLVAHHSSINYRAKHQLDPKTELDTVNNILFGLREIDNYLNHLKQ